jgi:hypothetical protein
MEEKKAWRIAERAVSRMKTAGDAVPLYLTERAVRTCEPESLEMTAKTDDHRHSPFRTRYIAVTNGENGVRRMPGGPVALERNRALASATLRGRRT